MACLVVLAGTVVPGTVVTPSSRAVAPISPQLWDEVLGLYANPPCSWVRPTFNISTTNYVDSVTWS